LRLFQPLAADDPWSFNTSQLGSGRDGGWKGLGGGVHELGLACMSLGYMFCMGYVSLPTAPLCDATAVAV
jgi:hypothetical protein